MKPKKEKQPETPPKKSWFILKNMQHQFVCFKCKALNIFTNISN